MSKIIGNTVGTPNPRPDWNQTDETKADYIKNKPETVTIIDETSSDTQYPTAKAVYDLVESIDVSGGSSSDDGLNSTAISLLVPILEEGVYNADVSEKMDELKDFAATSSGSSTVVDQEYNPESENPQSGKAVAQALAGFGGGGGPTDNKPVMEPADDDMPKVFFSGDITGMTKDNEKIIQFAYKSRTSDFGGYVKMKWQGSSSLSFPKKNFTIKMFSDETCETKLKKTFKDWNHEGNKYVLKANYIDHTHARNVVTANLWTEMVASRSDYESLPIELKNSPKNGAIDGFPIKLYLNGKYEGIYTWNIGKDDWMFGVDEDNVNQAVICAEKNNNGNSSTTDRNILACEFRANANIDGNDWDLEVPNVLHDNIKTSFNNLINCVKDTDDETFKATIGNYLDVTSALDYYILMYFSCAVDNLAKNLIMVTYDGVKWYCSAYDLDNIWGSRGTNTFVDGTFQCPEGYQDTNSLLWQRIEKCFANELYERYQTVRKNVLTFANVIDKFERFCDLIGTELYKEDVEIYSGIPYSTQNNLKQIRNFFTPRAEYVDACFAKPVPCTGISLNKSALTFTAEGTQTLSATVTPDGCTDAITWESNNISVAIVSDGVVTAVANGNATITAKCGEYSASCSVAVSGIAEPVPCTGIALDKTELVFTGEGTQTITAAVTPTDTTDSVVWVSSNPVVASIVVEDNVCTVQSVSNGEATITVTCGNYNATCSVTVSGIKTPYVLDGLYAHLDARDLQSGDTVWNSRVNSLAFDMSGFDDSAIANNAVTFSGNQTVECTQVVSAENGFTVEFAIADINLSKSCNRLFYHASTNKSSVFCVLNAMGWGGQHGWVVDTAGSNKVSTGVVTTLAKSTVAVTVAGDGTKTIYVNGVQKATGITIAPIDMEKIMLGYHSVYNNEGFEGALNAFRLYNRVLTSDEIVSNYESDVSAFDSANDEIYCAYSLNEPVTIASASDCFDTGVDLWNGDKNFTIAFNITSNDTSTTERCLFANTGGTSYAGIKFDVTNFYKLKVKDVNAFNTITTQIPATYTDTIKAVITHIGGSGEFTIKYLYEGEIIEQTITSIFNAHAINVWVGADDGWTGSPVRPWLGTINEFTIYYGVMSYEEIEAFLTA
jgi:uncharacterized protein YjdB